MYKKVALLSVLLCNMVFAQLSLHVDSVPASEVQTNASGAVSIGVQLDDGNSCFGHTIQLELSSAEFGTLNADACVYTVVFDAATAVLGGVTEGQSVSFTGSNVLSDAPEGAEYILNGLVYTFADALGDVTVTLTALTGSTFNGTTLTEDTVLDTLTVHHPEAGDPVTLDLSVHKKSLEMGTVDYSGNLYEGQEITVTATPNSNYRVKSWKGTDSKYPVEVQTVTLKKSKHKVIVQFEAIPSEEVSKAIFKAGKDRGESEDSFVIQGVMGASADNIPATGGSVEIVIKNEGGDELFSQTLDYTDENMTVNWPKNISYSDKEEADGSLEMFKYDIRKGKFTMKASDQDLTGWSAPLRLELTIGEMSVLILMTDSDDADVINGKKYMPSQFMIGQESSLTIDKEKIKEDDETVSGTVSGRFTTIYDPADYTLSTAEILYGDYSQILEVEKKNANKNIYTYKRDKDADPLVQFVTSATFNFEKAEFKLSYKDATFGTDETLGVTFGWDE